jgi:hypothetical protein
MEAAMAHRFTGMLTGRTLVLCVLAALLVRPGAAMAQAPKYEVTGFRKARFGMTEAEVRATARDSFRAKDDEMTVWANAVEGTTTLIVHVPVLEPDLCEGRVAYVFGYPSRRLIQVNVIWGEDTNPPLNDSGMIAGALRLKQHFLGYSWKARSVRDHVPIDANAVLLFSGADDRDGVVRLVLQGVRYTMVANGVLVSSPEPTIPPKLIISYIADSSDPEIRKLNRRDF